MCQTWPEHAADDVCFPNRRRGGFPLVAPSPEALACDGGWPGPLAWLGRAWWASPPPDGAEEARSILAAAALLGRRLRVGLFGASAADLAAAARAIPAAFPWAAIVMVVFVGGDQSSAELHLQCELLCLAAPDVVFAALPLQVFQESLASCSPAVPRAGWIRTGDSFQGAFGETPPAGADRPAPGRHEPAFDAGSTGAGDAPAIQEPKAGLPHPPAGRPREGAGL